MSDNVYQSNCSVKIDSAGTSDSLYSVRVSPVVKAPDYKKEPLSGLPAIEELKEFVQTNFDLLNLGHNGRITYPEIESIAKKVSDLSLAAKLRPASSMVSAEPSPKSAPEMGPGPKVDPVELDTGYTEEMFLANDFSHPRSHPNLRKQAARPAMPTLAARVPSQPANPSTPLDPTEAVASKILDSQNGQQNIEALEDLFPTLKVNVFRDGISRKDLDTLGGQIADYKKWRSNQKEVVPDAYALANFGIANFQKLDKNGDGQVSFDEVEQAIKSSTNPEDLHQLKEIETAYWELTYPYGLPLTMVCLSQPHGIRPGNFEGYIFNMYYSAPQRYFDFGQQFVESYKMIRMNQLQNADCNWRAKLLDK